MNQANADRAAAMSEPRRSHTPQAGTLIYRIGFPGLAWRDERITALRLETVSRIIKSFERSGILRPVRIEGVHAMRSFPVNFGALATRVIAGKILARASTVVLIYQLEFVRGKI